MTDKEEIYAFINDCLKKEVLDICERQQKEINKLKEEVAKLKGGLYSMQARHLVMK